MKKKVEANEEEDFILAIKEVSNLPRPRLF